MAAASIAGMFIIETAYAPFPAQVHLTVGFILMPIVCFGPMLVLRHESMVIRRIQRVNWLQCSFWLLLPWLSVPVAVFTAYQWFRLRTKHLLPGD